MNQDMEQRLIALEAHRGRIHLRMTAQFLGRDLSVTLSGGDRPHIGAVALAQPQASSSALSLPRHREEALARNIASTLSIEFNTTVCVVCGIHLDDILDREITEVLEMSDDLTHELSRHLEGIEPS